MANVLWEGTSLNNNRLASAFNRMLFNQTISLTKRKNGLVYAILGKKEPGSLDGNGKVSFPKLKIVSGNKHEMKFSGKLRTVRTVAHGAEEVERVTPSYDSTTFGAIEFTLTNLIHKEYVPGSDYRHLVGKEAKTASYVEDIINVLAESFEVDMANRLWGNTNQTELTLGSIPWIVDDETTYGLDRSQEANADHRAQVKESTGSLTLAKIAIEQNRCLVGGGDSSLGLGDVTQYSKVQELVRDQVHAYSDPHWDSFGGTFVKFGGTAYVLDQRMPAASLYHLDPSTWLIVEKEGAGTSTGLILDPTLNDAYVIPTQKDMGVFCKKCAANGKMVGIS